MKKGMKLFLLIAAAICLMGNALSETAEESPNTRYQRGMLLFSQDRFAEAAAVFSQLGGYEDAAKLTMYCRAAAAGENGDIESAIASFTALGDYKESKMMITYYEGRFNEMIAEKNNGIVCCHYFYKAIDSYQTILFFRDTEERIGKCRRAIYDEAGRIEETGNLLAADELYSGIFDYPDVKEKLLSIWTREAELGIKDIKVITTEGFTGENVTIHLATDGGKVLALWIEAFNETAGLGQKVMEEEFISQFIGKTAPFTFGEDGIEAVTAATYTSDAVLKAINEALEKEETVSETAEGRIAGWDGDVRTGSAKGFFSEVRVKVGLEGKTVRMLEIDASNEATGLGQKVMEETFINQFINKEGPFTYGKNGIEAVSGATFTSKAVLQAINEALGFENDAGEKDVNQMKRAEESGTEIPAAAEGEAAVSQGFGGEVTVHAVLDGKTVKALTIDTPYEVRGMGQKVSEEAFTSQFIGKEGPFTYGENGIEAITGATLTSRAVLTALNRLFDEAAEEPEAETVDSSRPVYGSYMVKKETNFSVIRVYVDTAAGQITNCRITSEGDSDLLTDEIRNEWAKAIVEHGTAETDVITGATLIFSAGAVIEAVNEILEGLK